MDRNSHIHAIVIISVVASSILHASSNAWGQGEERASTQGVSTSPFAKSELFSELSIPFHQLFVASFKFGEKDNVQQLVFAPLKLKEGYTDLLSELQLNVSQKQGLTTFGVGLAWNGLSPRGSRGKRVLEETFKNVPAFAFERRKDEPAAQAKAREAYERGEYEKREIIPRYDAFYKNLATNGAVVRASCNVQTFELVGGDDIDKDGDGLAENEYAVKMYDLSAGASLSLTQGLGFAGEYHYSKKRRSALEGESLLPYHGGTLVGAVRVWALGGDSYRNTEAYRTTGFIPAINVGASIDYQDCAGDASLSEDGVDQTWVISPFVDFRLSPVSQFGMKFAVRVLDLADGTDRTELRTLVLYGLQVGGAKN